jgi:hypothetical protein
VIAHPFARSQPPPPRTYLSTATVYSCCDRGPPPAALPPPSCALGADCTVPHLNPRHRRTSACPRFVQNFPLTLTSFSCFCCFSFLRPSPRGRATPCAPSNVLCTSFMQPALRLLLQAPTFPPCSPPYIRRSSPRTSRVTFLAPRCSTCSRGSCVCVPSLSRFPRTTGDPLHSPLSSLTQILRPAFSSPFPSPPR